ncbi:MAG: hypothetical protein A4E23_01446 [Methanomethylovorans sp. PtaU1.Bin073]|nr:MAG: hypothetical protein A4E23_01446 [Methanomethylovorans sp. PtaU1.Bin073]
MLPKISEVPQLKIKHSSSYVIILVTAILMVLSLSSYFSEYGVKLEVDELVLLSLIAMISMSIVNISDEVHDDNKSVITELDKKHSAIIKELSENDYKILKELGTFFHHKYVKFADRIGDSDFEFFKLAQKTTKSIRIMGPSLRYFTTKDDNKNEIKATLFNKLKNDDFKICIIIQDQRKEQICNFLDSFVYETGFKDHLQQSTKKFAKWLSEAKDKNQDNFEIYVSHSVTFTLMIFDAEDEDSGFLIVIPVPYKSLGPERASFMIEKKYHTNAFNFYLESFETMYTIAKHGNNDVITANNNGGN